MARYLQRISLLGRERWIGWEIDGIGTEVPGLALADDLSDEEIRARGVKEFRAMPFESFLGLGAMTNAGSPQELLDEDVDYRLDALLVGMERIRAGGNHAVPRALLLGFLGDDAQLAHPVVQARFAEWEAAGLVDIVSENDCYLRIKARLA